MAGLQIYGEDQKLLYTADIYAHKKRHRGPWTDDYTFSLFDIKEGEASAPFSQIKISYEPAGNLIWMSFYITIIGFAMMILLSHRKFWVKVEEKDGNYHVTLSGWASRNAEVIKHDLKKIKELAC
jgi:cytochrome c biogenesis protein ResB